MTFNMVPVATTQNSLARVLRVLAILIMAVGIAIGFVYLLLTWVSRAKIVR